MLHLVGLLLPKNSLVDIWGSEFVANTARENGGGLYVQFSSRIRLRQGSVGVIEDTNLKGNVAEVGGGCINKMWFVRIKT